MASSLPAKLHEEFLTCKICYEPFKQPKILSCLHSFCAGCLEGYINQQGTDNQDAVCCPLCRQPTPIPTASGGIGALKDNFFLASLQDAVGDAPVCDSCEARGEARPALTRCRDCNECLCDVCLHAHQRLNLTKNHVLTPIGEQQPQEQQDPPPLSPDQPSPSGSGADPPVELSCSQHPAEESKLYCQQCNVPVCVTCKLTQHEGHRCCSLSEAASEQRDALNKLLEAVDSRVDEYEKILEDWRKYRNTLDKQQHAMQAKIDKRREELMSLVGGWHYATSQQLSATYETEKKHIAAKIDMVDVQLSTHRSVCDLAANILQQAPKPQVLKLKDQISADISNLQRHNLNAICLTQKSILTFNVGGQSLNFDHFGAFLLSHEKVISSVRVRPEQHITLVTEFNTRQDVDSAMSSRFDTCSVAATSDGFMVVADRQTDRIAVFNAKGELQVTVSTAVLGKPICATVMTNGDIVFSRDKHSICVYNNQGKHKKTLKDNLAKPCSVCVGPDNILYILDYQTKTVTKYDIEYNRIGHVKLGYGKSSMWDRVGVTSQGNLYLSCYAENCIIEFTPDGEKLAVAGRWGSTGAGDIYWPRGVCIDGHDNVLIADTHNDRMQLLSPLGVWTMLSPADKLRSPTDVAVMHDGKLCVLEKNGTVKLFEYLPY